MPSRDDLRSVIVWFKSAEQMLGEVLDVVPYEAAHENVWSPRLVTVLLETCSQLDSLLKHQAMQSAYAAKKLDITHYFEYFGKYLSTKWAIIWGDTPQRVAPYQKWDKCTTYTATSYAGHELDWWTANNKVKHDRIKNRKEGKLRFAVESLGGLFLAILYCEVCRDAVAASGWLQSSSHNPAANLDDHLNPQPDRYVVAETQLFSYPVGWMNKPIKKHLMWAGAASDRFRAWFQEMDE